MGGEITKCHGGGTLWGLAPTNQKQPVRRAKLSRGVGGGGGVAGKERRGVKKRWRNGHGKRGTSSSKGIRRMRVFRWPGVS